MELVGKVVHCPDCDTLLEVDPVSFEARGVDLDKSGTDRTLYVETRVSAFVPPLVRVLGYAIVICLHCGIRVVVEVHDYKGPRVVWPLPGVSVPNAVPEPIRSAVIDAKRAHAVGSITAAVMSARTAVARIQRRESVDSLTDLWAARQLPPSLFDTANETRLWGHVVAHDDFDPAAINTEHVAELLDFLDIVLEMVYVTPDRLALMKSARKGLNGHSERPESGGVVSPEAAAGSQSVSPPVDG